MKKLLSILVVGLSMLLIPAAGKAQTPGTFSQTASNATGAITNTSVDTMTYLASRSYRLVSIQPIVTKTSGTMAGWSVLDYSVDGTNWKIGTDTLSLANATTNTTVWDKATAAKYFRIRTGGATTVAGTCTALISATQ